MKTRIVVWTILVINSMLSACATHPCLSKKVIAKANKMPISRLQLEQAINGAWKWQSLAATGAVQYEMYTLNDGSSLQVSVLSKKAFERNPNDKIIEIKMND